MPRVISYTPAWLSRPSPGFKLFNNTTQKQESTYRTVNGSNTEFEYVNANKTIARRNAEVFVVVGKQIRWADLPSLKDQWQATEETPSKKPKGKSIEDSEDKGEGDAASKDGSYRVYKTTRFGEFMLRHATGVESQHWRTYTTASFIS